MQQKRLLHKTFNNVSLLLSRDQLRELRYAKSFFCFCLICNSPMWQRLLTLVKTREMVGACLSVALISKTANFTWFLKATTSKVVKSWNQKPQLFSRIRNCGSNTFPRAWLASTNCTAEQGIYCA
ncbi:UNVERIFIED_CONTAM: hypothetical protein NCL1_44372 [Trichonephila clavipes]